jgi:hypothetical protein
MVQVYAVAALIGSAVMIVGVLRGQTRAFLVLLGERPVLPDSGPQRLAAVEPAPHQPEWLMYDTSRVSLPFRRSPPRAWCRTRGISALGGWKLWRAGHHMAVLSCVRTLLRVQETTVVVQYTDFRRLAMVVQRQ